MRLIAFHLLGVCVACAQGADIRSALEEVRSGNLQVVATLSVTATDVPVLAEFLKDPNEDVAREAVTLLTKVGDPASCAALVTALTSTSADVRERAARAIHGKCQLAGAEGLPNLEAALRQSVEMGNSAAAGLLLLGRFSDNQNREFLKGLIAAKTPLVKLAAWNTPVPQGLAAAVAGVSAGVVEARPRLVEGLTRIEQAEFLTSVLRDITDFSALQSLLPILDNQQTIRAGVPSGAQPQRRLCDLGVDAFVTRLNLQIAFALRPSDRYSAEQIAVVKRLAADAIARR